MTEEEKAVYLEEIYQRDGVRLNPDNIAKNPGKRKVTHQSVQILSEFKNVVITQLHLYF